MPHGILCGILYVYIVVCIYYIIYSDAHAQEKGP